MIFGKKKTKKLRTRPFWWTQLQQLQWKKYLLIITIVSLFCALFLWWHRVYKKTMWSPKYTMSKVIFAPESVNALRNIELYTAVSEALQGKNYFRTKRLHKKDILRELQLTHPLIADFVLEHTTPWSVYVTIVFQRPALLRQTPSAYFVSYDEDIYPVSIESVLTQWLTPIQLPRFSSWRTDINGIYRWFSEQELVKRLQLIEENLGTWSLSELIYQPGGKKLFVTYKGKRVYFNLQKDMLPQIDKLLALEQHRAWFPDVWTIDVGSREEAVVK